MAVRPRYWSWSTGAQLARLPMAMEPLAFTSLTAAWTGSYATGGAMVTASVAGEVLFAIPAGRLLDRIGVSQATRTLLAIRALAYLVLTTAAVTHQPAPALIALAVPPSALGAGALSGFRALLTSIVGKENISRALAINAMIVEGVIIAGPALVGVLILTKTAALPLLTMAAISLTAVLFVPNKKDANRPTPTQRTGSLLRPLLAWCATGFALGHITSSIEVAALPLVARLHAGPPAAALLVMVMCGASVLGGLIYAKRGKEEGQRTAVWLLAIMTTGAVTVALATGWVMLTAGAVVIGLCLAPLATIQSTQAERLLPEPRRAEGFALLNTTQAIGFGLGALTLAVLPATQIELTAAATGTIATALLTRSKNPTQNQKTPLSK